MSQLDVLLGITPFVPPDGIIKTRLNILEDKDRNRFSFDCQKDEAQESKSSKILKLIQEGTKLNTEEISELLDVSVSSINRVKMQSNGISPKYYVNAKTMGDIQDAIATNPTATQDRIAEISGYSVSTVKSAIRKLKEDGLQVPKMQKDGAHTRFVSERILNNVRIALSVNPQRFRNCRGGISVSRMQADCGATPVTISAAIKLLIELGEISFLGLAEYGGKTMIVWKDKT